jgi:hypothetical protein
MVISAAEAPLMVAATTVDLTPPAGLPLGGYVLREGAVATGAHDPLQASLVRLRGRGSGDVLWVALDALAVDAELARAIADGVASATGCSPDAVLVCATHTHSSAAGWLRALAPFMPEEADARLRDRLVRRLTDAARELPARLEPCWPLLGEGHAPRAGGNRNDPTGPHDPSVGTLGLVDAEGRLAAAVVDYACHATVLGHANLAWSADWPGAARRTLADALAGSTWLQPEDATRTPTRRAPIAVLQGAAGDASPRFVRRNQGFGEVDRLGGLVAAAALSGLLEAAPQRGAAPVFVMERTVRLPTRRLPDRQAVHRLVAEAERSWQAARSTGAAAAEERIARTRYEGALMLSSLADAGLPPSIDASVRVVAIGGAAWVHLPVELFASFGLAIRRASAFGWTRVIGYTNDYLGYVADEAAHRDGVFEALASRFDARAGEALVETAAALLAEAARLVEPSGAPVAAANPP